MAPQASPMKPDNMIKEVPARLLAAAAGIVMLVMMLHICADVVGRYLFDSPLPGTLEIASGYELSAIVFLPLAYVTLRREHISAELFTNRLAPRSRAGLDLVICLLAIAYVGLLTWQTAISAISSTESGEVWETANDLLVIWPSRWLLPLAFGLTTLQFAWRAGEALRVLSKAERTDAP